MNPHSHSQPRLARGVPLASAEVRLAAENLLRRRLTAYCLGLEQREEGLFALVPPSGRPLLLKLLAASAPHRRGGRGSFGLHWLLQSDVEDYVAMVDLSRAAVWLLSAADFRAQAQRLPAGRFHLDWLVLRLSPRSRVPDEEAFAGYLLEEVIEREGWTTDPGARP